MERFLSVKEVAKLLGISRVAIVKQIQAGKLRATKVGRAYVINRDDLNIIQDKTISNDQKAEIEKAVEKTIQEYGETLRLLKDA